MNKHTPGPWEAIARLSGSENHKGYRLYQRDKGYWFGEVYPIDEDGNEGCANARLIAAAPELLEALKAMLGPKKYRQMWLSEELEAIEMAEAAIAKAEGDQ